MLRKIHPLAFLMVNLTPAAICHHLDRMTNDVIKINLIVDIFSHFLIYAKWPNPFIFFNVNDATSKPPWFFPKITPLIMNCQNFYCVKSIFVWHWLNCFAPGSHDSTIKPMQPKPKSSQKSIDHRTVNISTSPAFGKAYFPYLEDFHRRNIVVWDQ